MRYLFPPFFIAENGPLNWLRHDDSKLGYSIEFLSSADLGPGFYSPRCPIDQQVESLRHKPGLPMPRSGPGRCPGKDWPFWPVENLWHLWLLKPYRTSTIKKTHHRRHLRPTLNRWRGGARRPRASCASRDTSPVTDAWGVARHFIKW